MLLLQLALTAGDGCAGWLSGVVRIGRTVLLQIAGYWRAYCNVVAKLNGAGNTPMTDQINSYATEPLLIELLLLLDRNAAAVTADQGKVWAGGGAASRRQVMV